MTFEVMVSAKALRTNIALEGSILLRVVMYTGMVVVSKYA